jgi:hypothetical protein
LIHLHGTAQETIEWHIDQGKLVLESSGQISPSTRIVRNECEFDVVLRNGDTVYLQTNDTHFVTPEGYAVGVAWKDLKPEDQLKLVKMTGWGYFIVLDSGWSIAFCEGQSCTDQAPANDSLIRWIFRGKD